VLKHRIFTFLPLYLVPVNRNSLYIDLPIGCCHYKMRSNTASFSKADSHPRLHRPSLPYVDQQHERLNLYNFVYWCLKIWFRIFESAALLSLASVIALAAIIYAVIALEFHLILEVYNDANALNFAKLIAAAILSFVGTGALLYIWKILLRRFGLSTPQDTRRVRIGRASIIISMAAILWGISLKMTEYFGLVENRSLISVLLSYLLSIFSFWCLKVG